MSLPLYPDGCIVPNLRTKHYVVYFAPRCEHGRLRGAFVAIEATSPEDAFEYATHSIRLAKLHPVSVTEVANVPSPEFTAIESAV